MKILPFDVFFPTSSSLKRTMYVSTFNTIPATNKEKAALSAPPSIINVVVTHQVSMSLHSGGINWFKRKQTALLGCSAHSWLWAQETDEENTLFYQTI